MSTFDKQLIRFINKNDTDKLLRLFQDNDDIIISPEILTKCIKKQAFESFEVLLDNITIDNKYSECYRHALTVNKKHDDSRFIKTLLDLNLDIDPSKINVVDLYLYNKELFKLYINKIVDEYAHNEDFDDETNYMYLLLVELLHNKTFSYFLKLFNKYVNADNQVKLVKKEVYGHKIITDTYKSNGCQHTYAITRRLQACKNIAFSHFLISDDKIFDYNTLMCSTPKDFDEYNVLNLYSEASKNYKPHLNNFKLYLKKNPIDFSILNKITKKQFEYFYNGVSKFDVNDIIIDGPEYDLLFNSLDKHETFTKKIEYRIINNFYGIQTLYKLHKMGFKFNIYNKITPELLNEYCKLNNNGTYENADTLLFYIIFGNTIGQKVPNKLKDTIYKICDNSKELTHVYKINDKQ
jgi:hypothetical protein